MDNPDFGNDELGQTFENRSHEDVLYHFDCRDKGRRNALTGIWQNAFREFYQKNPEEMMQFASNAEKEILGNYLRNVNRGARYLYFVINFKDDIPLSTIMKKMQKACRKVWISRYIWTLEQRGNDEDSMGMGIHGNIVIEVGRYKRPCEAKREMYNTFKHCVGNQMHVCMRRSHDPTNFLKYTLGEKEESKMELVEWDRIWRDSLGIEDYYGDIEFVNEYISDIVEDDEEEEEGEME